MGQFKPMIKMETTEPSVELKLKKGGHATHKHMKKGGSAEHGHKKMHHMMDGGVLGALSGTPALVGRPAVNAPVQAPGKPSMAARRKAMMAAPAMGRMKKGGEVETAKEHKAEMKEMGKIEKELKSHESKPASKAHHGLKHGGKAKKYATGGVALANAGGYKKGGKIGAQIPEEETYGNYDTTEVHQASKRNPKAGTGGIKESNAGGYKRGGHAKHMKDGGLGEKIDRFETKTTIENDEGPYEKTKMHQAKPDHARAKTGAVKESNAGGYKRGGHAAKKHFATGGAVNNAGRAVAMPQGSKKAPSPVSISQLSGTYRSGGKVTRPEAALLKAHKEENAASMKAAKKDSDLPDREVLPASRMLKRGGRC